MIYFKKITRLLSVIFFVKKGKNIKTNYYLLKKIDGRQMIFLLNENSKIIVKDYNKKY